MSCFHEEPCTDCGSNKLKEIGSDLTCMNCGLVAQAGRLSLEPEWRHFGDNDNDPSRVGLPTFNKEDDEAIQLFKYIVVDEWPDVIIQDAKSIMEAFKSAKNGTLPYKGDTRKKTFVAACIYFAAKKTAGNGRTKEEIATNMIICSKTLNKMCNDIEETLHIENKLKNGTKVTDMINRYVSAVAPDDKEAYRNIRKTVHKLYDKIQHKESVISVSPSALMATLLYMACMYLKVKVTMKYIAFCCDISITTLINTEKIIKSLLTAKT